MSLQESNCEGGGGKGRVGEPGQAENYNNHKQNKQIISFYYIFIYYYIYLKAGGKARTS